MTGYARHVEHAFVDEASSREVLDRIEPIVRALDHAEKNAASPSAALVELVRVLGTKDVLAFVAPNHAKTVAGDVSSRRLSLARERLGHVSPLADLAFAMQGLGSYPIILAGSAETKAAWLPRVRAGTAIAAFALTEPEAGSDLDRIACSAERDGESYVLSGEKTLISNAGVAHFYSLFAATAPRGERHRISAFAVPADAKGLTVTPMRVLGGHPIGALRLDGVRVSASSRIGDEGRALAVALATLQRFRPTVGAAALGMAQRALDESIAHTRARIQFDRPLAEQPVIQSLLAEMVCAIETSRLAVYRAAALADTGAPREVLARTGSIAKLVATESAQRVVDLAVQLHGGRGVVLDSIPARLYEDIRALRIYEGASEVQRALIAREVLRA